jgi:D-alanine-D-alanine ligase
MAKKTRILLLCGGKSAEHEVSLRSARNVANALGSQHYEIALSTIDKDGKWSLNDLDRFLSAKDDTRVIADTRLVDGIHLLSGAEPGTAEVWSRGASEPHAVADVVFPVLHGPNGEDGTIQGLLKLIGVPFVGAGVLGSAVGMDKDVMKRLLRDAGLPIGKFQVVQFHERQKIDLDAVIAALKLPIFVKPANMGSSVGVSRADDRAALVKAIEEAFRFDRKIMLEETIVGHEVECSVIGNYGEQEASLPGEIVTGKQHAFYSYSAKYVDDQDQRIEIPAKLPAKVIEEVRHCACRAAEALCCEGMARVDFFVTNDDRVLINEINSIPGFTNISMYPMMLRKSGFSDAEMMKRLIEAAKKRFAAELALK